MLKIFNFFQENASKRNCYFLPRLYLHYTGNTTVFLIEIIQIIADYQVLGDGLPVKILEYICLGNIILNCAFSVFYK